MAKRNIIMPIAPANVARIAKLKIDLQAATEKKERWQRKLKAAFNKFNAHDCHVKRIIAEITKLEGK